MRDLSVQIATPLTLVPVNGRRCMPHPRSIQSRTPMRTDCGRELGLSVAKRRTQACSHARLSEHGAGLSGGRRQCFATARALLKRPSIQIFDETTSSPNADTAERFKRTVNRLEDSVTIKFIAQVTPTDLEEVEEIELLGYGGANSKLPGDHHV